MTLPIILTIAYLKQNITLSWSPGQKYQSYPTYRVRIKSKWPSIYLNYTQAIPLTDSYMDYSKIKLTVIDNFVPTKILGYLMYRLEAGSFLNQNKVHLIDQFHFRGNHLIGGFKSPYLQTFKLQEGYEFSSPANYVAGWF